MTRSPVAQWVHRRAVAGRNSSTGTGSWPAATSTSGRTRTRRRSSARRNAAPAQRFATAPDVPASSGAMLSRKRGRRTPSPPATRFEGVERRLVAEVPVAGRHRALLDLVVDAAHDAPRRRLALGEADERLDLPREAADRRAAPAVVGPGTSTSQRSVVAEQHGRLVVEVVAGGDDVVAAVARRRRRTDGASTVRTPSTAPDASPSPRSARRSRVRRRRSISAAARPRSAAKARGVLAALVGVLADAETEVQPSTS